MIHALTLNLGDRSMNQAQPPSSDVRLDLLQRLAEQAMSDPEFRAIARDDLGAALRAHGYDLNEREMGLVMRFRASLAEAGVDLFLNEAITDDQLAAILRDQL